MKKISLLQFSFGEFNLWRMKCDASGYNEMTKEMVASKLFFHRFFPYISTDISWLVNGNAFNLSLTKSL